MPVSGAVIVTTPQEIALLDARKGLKMFQKVEVNVLGVVENMSTHVCTHCGHEEHIFGAGGGEKPGLGPVFQVPFLGSLPLDLAHTASRLTPGRPHGGGRAREHCRRPLPGHRPTHHGAAGPGRQGIRGGLPQDRDRGITDNDREHERMSIKADKWIRRMAEKQGMIEPFEPGQVRQNGGGRIVSYGTSSYGYDVRCADEFKIFTNINSTIVDPKQFDERSFVDFKGACCVIPPNSFALARTVEFFRIPRSVLTVCLGKSTYARCGIIVNVTPLEPEWEGHVTLEFSNTTPLPAKIYANEGVAQMLFFESDEICETSYKDRGGKYQGQKGVTLPKT